MNNQLALRGTPPPGLNGFFDWLGDAVHAMVVAVATSVGGPIAGSFVSWGWTKLAKFMKMPYIGDGGGLRGLAIPHKLVARDWVSGVFQQWAVKEASVLKGSEDTSYLKSAEYRKNVNKVLTGVNAVRAYYRGHEEVNRLNIQDQYHGTANTKDLVAAAYEVSVKEAYVRTMAGVGVDVSYTTKTMMLSDWNGSTPRDIDNIGVPDAQIKFVVFAEPGKGSAEPPAPQTGSENNGSNGNTNGNTNGSTGSENNEGNGSTNGNTNPENNTSKPYKKLVKKWDKLLTYSLIGGIIYLAMPKCKPKTQK